MEARDKISFLNSIDEIIFCSECGTENSRQANFCKSCGHEIKVLQQDKQLLEVDSKEDEKNIPFKPIKELPKLEFKKINFNSEPEVEEENSFATGFPEWNIEPPMVVVRRKNK